MITRIRSKGLSRKCRFVQIDEASFHVNSRSLVPVVPGQLDTHRVQCSRGDFCISEHKVSLPFFHRCCTHPSSARVLILSEDENAKTKKKKKVKNKREYIHIKKSVRFRFRKCQTYCQLSVTKK